MIEWVEFDGISAELGNGGLGFHFVFLKKNLFTLPLLLTSFIVILIECCLHHYMCTLPVWLQGFHLGALFLNLCGSSVTVLDCV